MITPFENLVQELGREMGVVLHVDPQQSCLLFFPENDLSIQIDLDSNADQLLVGTRLGTLHPGPLRRPLLVAALSANGTASHPQGILAYSEKQSALVLFQFLLLDNLTGKNLYQFLEHFKAHALHWKEALEKGKVPETQSSEELPSPFSRPTR